MARNIWCYNGEMRIGLYFTAGKNNGGVYQYSLAFLEALSSISDNEYFIVATSSDIPAQFYKDKRFTVVNLSQSSKKDPIPQTQNPLSILAPKLINFIMRCLYLARLDPLITLATRLSCRKTIAIIDSLALDLLVFPAGTDLSYVVNVPTIVAVHDLQHRLHPEFKELSAGGRFGYRENYYRQTCRKANFIMVDSSVGKEDVIYCYPEVDPNKIVILPFLSPPYLEPSMTISVAKRALRPFDLASPFIYYPAQFWSHKNHLNLVEAMHILHKRGHKLGLALIGSTKVDFSTYNSVIAKIKEYHMSKYIKYLGYVENKVVSALYKQALAMVMPTFMGPTNIPVLEAWVMGTPVITSDIRGCREQAKGASLLVDPYNPVAIADAIQILLVSPQKRAELIKAGTKRIEAWSYSDFAKVVKGMINSCHKS